MAARMEQSRVEGNKAGKTMKRKIDIVSEPDAKKLKDSPYNEIEFKFHLKDPSTVFLGFGKFLEAAVNWSNGEGEDIVVGYCRSSPDCEEVLKILDGGSRKLPELQLVFGCLEKILLRIADDLNSKYYTTGQTIVKKLLANHVQAIFSTLNVKNRSIQIKTSLKLLISMIMLGPSTAKLVLNNIDLSHNVFHPLFQRRDVKDTEDVRTCMTHLLLACLLAGDNEVIRKVIQTKGVMENLFTGMEFDRIDSLQLVLSTLLEKVILSTGISKTAKAQMFSDKGLKELGRLYNWQGLSKWKQNFKQRGKRSAPQVTEEPGSEVDEDKTLVAEIADKFLMEVCTSYKHGIIFLDKSFGMSGRSQNRLITGLLRSLSGQLSHLLVEKLVVSILTACPDQLQYFLPNISHSLLPRETSKWISTMKFLMKVYSNLEKNMTVLKLKNKKPVTEMVQILLVYTLPPLQILNTVLPGIKEKSIVVNHIVLGLIQQLTDNAVHVLKSLPQLTIYTAAEVTELHRLYKAFVCKNLPEVVSISKCFDKALALLTSQSDEISKLQDFCSVTISDALIQVEQVLCLYQELQPTLLDEHPIILGKLLEGIMGNQSDGKSSSSEVYVLKLLAGTEAKRLPWGKKNSSGHSLLYQLLKMLTQTSTDDYLTDVTTHLIRKLLLGTGQFESHEDDLQVWLQILKSCEGEVLDFVCTVLMTYIHNPFPYMDRMSDLDLDVTMETKTNKKNYSVDDILKMDIGDLDDCPESEKGIVMKKRFPFCPLLLVAMETLDKMESISEGVKIYISRIVLSTFYQQSDPVPLCSMLSRFKSRLLLPKLHDYILTWKLGDNQGLDPDLSSLRYREFVAANDESVTLDVDALGKLQEELLHLNYLLRISNKDVSKKLVKLVKSRKKNILSNCQEIRENGLEQNDTSSSIPNVSDLLLPVKPNHVVSGLRLVLNNPVIKHYFLHKGNEDQSEKISGILTDLVKDTLRLVVQVDIDVNDEIQFYYQKVKANLLEVFRGKDTKVKVVFKVATSLIPKLSDEQCREIFDLVLNTKCSDYTNYSNYLVPLLSLLLERLIKSRFKSVKLTDTGLERLLYCLGGEDSGSELTSFFKKFPVLCAQCSEEVVETLMSADLCSLVEYFMENNVIVTNKVGEMIVSGCLDLTCESHLRITHCYLRVSLQKADNQEDETKVCTKIVKRLKTEILSICGTDEVEYSDILLQITKLLIERKSLGEKLTTKAKKRLSSVLNDGESVEMRHVDLLSMLYDGDDRDVLMQQSVSCMVTVLPLNKEKLTDKLLSYVSRCTQTEVEILISSWTVPSDVWCKLLENTLNFVFTKPSAIKFLTSVMSVIYKKNDIDSELTLVKVIDMVMNNSSFLPVMFGEIGTEIKDLMVSMILCMVELCPQVCHTDHISVYLGAYNASLSLTDQKLLKLLHLYEQNEISFTNYKPFLWGEKAIEQHALRKSLGPSLKGVTPLQVVENTDIKLLTHSILKFPLRRKLQESDSQPAETYKSESDCYDPCFLLPLMSHLVQPECIIDCRRFTEKGCLGYIFAALSSHDENVRNVAVHVLRNFQGHMEIAKIQEREQLKYLVELVLKSLPENNKLSSIITQFLARTSKLLLKLDEHMYTIVNGFLLMKPVLDVKNVPEFFKMFNSSALQYQTERSWILSLMYDGMRESADYWIYEKRFIYKLLQAFYMSSMADVQSQVQVLNILMATCKERRLALDLCQNHGFLIWIAAAINKLSGARAQPHESLCQLLHIVWCSVVDNKQTDDDKLQLSFSIEMLTCLKSLLLNISGVSDASKVIYVKTLSATVKHIQSMLGSLRGHVSQTVSHSDIMLLLLHCQNKWTQSKTLTHSIRGILNSLGRDTSLLESLNSQTDKKQQDSSLLHEEMEIDQSVVEMEDSTSENIKEDDVQVQIAEEVFKIVDVWKMSSPVADSDGLAAADVVVLRWLLDHVKRVPDINMSFKTVAIISKTLMSETKGITRNCARFIAMENCSLGRETVIDIFNMFTVLAEKYHKLSTADQTDFNDERNKAEKLLNRVLLEILTLKSSFKDEKHTEVSLKTKDGCSEEEMKSIYIQQMFIAQL